MEAISVTVSILKNKFQQQLLYRLPLNLLPANLATSSFGELSERLVGTLVAVPLGKGNQLQAAIVWEVKGLEAETKLNLKDVASLISKEPALTAKQLDLAKLIAWRYQCSLAHALNLFLVREELKIKANSVKRKSTVPKYQRYIAKIVAELEPTEQAKLKLEPTLTEEQEMALKAISQAKIREFLLHGVTGSGKTEIYLQLAKQVLAKGQTCLILVPEINLSYPMIQTFSLRFPNLCGIWHSQMSAGEKLSCKQAIKDGQIKILIGTRSALFSNLDKIGLIVIDEEHDSSYQSETIPHYQTASIARLLLRMQPDACLILASATPDVSTYYRASTAKSQLIELKERVHKQALPKIDLVDLRLEANTISQLILAKRTEQAIQNCLNLGEQVLLLLNRRGYNVCYLCKDCGQAMQCERCDFRLVYHQNINKLLCHYCGKTYALPSHCPKCKTGSLINFGFGTEKLEEYLQMHFKDAKIARLDQDVSQKKQAANQILSAFKRGEYQILLGTQMIAKGHDFANIGLVCILAIDSILAMPDYQAEECCFQLITQAAGRAGRQGQAAHVLLQTFDPKQACLQAAINNDYAGFYKQQLIWRKRLGLPPFQALGMLKLQIKHKTLNASELNEFLQRVNNTLQSLCLAINQEKPNYGVMIWPSSLSNWRKINQEYSLIVKVSSKAEAAIAYLYHKLQQQKLPLPVSFSLYFAD